MDSKTKKFIDAVHAAIDAANINPLDQPMQRAWETIKSFIEWAETDAPSWVEVEASLQEVDSPDVCEMLNNRTLFDIARKEVCKTYIGNAFSLGMIPQNLLGKVRFAPSSEAEVRKNMKHSKSIVGHADTAAVLGVGFNRESVTLEAGDVLYVAQLQGGRLPEGCKTLPEGFRFEWVKVELFTLYE